MTKKNTQTTTPTEKTPSKKSHATVKVSKKNPTTNYPKDTHRFFCKRCMGYNGGCPITGGKPDPNCKL